MMLEVCAGEEEEMAQRFQEACAFSDALLAVFQIDRKSAAAAYAVFRITGMPANFEAAPGDFAEVGAA